MLLFLKEGFLDNLALKQVSPFALQCVSYIKSVHPDVYNTIAQTQDISDEVHKQVYAITTEFIKLFIPIIS
jgi:F0F1-type ATP synthase alpha subunit